MTEAPAALVLVVEDDAASRQALVELLCDAGYGVDAAADGQQALRAVERAPPDVVISDIRMPEVDGLTLVSRLRALPGMQDVPVLLVSGLPSAECLPGFELGADDYLSKPIDGAELLVRLAAHLRRSRSNRELRRQSLVDELTQVLNRRGTFDVLRRELERARRSGDSLAVMMVDVDGFKAVNDRHGHAAGDEVLRAVAGALAAEVRAGDRVGRLGGDEFVVVLPGVDASTADGLTQRLMARANDDATAVLPDSQPMTVSIGVAISRADDTADTVLTRADGAMYAYKQRTGRGLL